MKKIFPALTKNFQGLTKNFHGMPIFLKKDVERRECLAVPFPSGETSGAPAISAACGHEFPPCKNHFAAW
ncbi:MAG: hypothetical protein PUF07_05420 [Bacteroidales bacterium]|nr:hypothetical protein [Bacteroidales bacterium]